MHHLIFEGAELSGKSWLMSQVYNYLEPKYNQNKNILDGCHWFNTDIGIYGTDYGEQVIKKYLEIFKILKQKNLIIEKFYLTDFIYNFLKNKQKINYAKIEDELLKLNFKIILITFPNSLKILEKRLADRLSLYPHYARIAKKPEDYLAEQKIYLKEIKKTKLPFLIVETDQLPDEKPVRKILKWIGEV